MSRRKTGEPGGWVSRLPGWLKKPAVWVEFLVGAIIVGLIVVVFDLAPTARLPEPPTGIEVSARDSVAMVSWNAAAASQYVVEVGPTAEAKASQRLTVDTTFAVVSQLKPSSSYSVRVTSVMDGRLGHPSEPFTFTTPADEYDTPAPAVEAGSRSGGVVVSWEAVALGARYRVQLADEKSMAKAKSVVVDALEQGFADVQNGKTYYVRVRAEDKAGAPLSSWSSVKAVTVTAPLRVASYNIRQANLKGPSWASRRPAVIAAIREQHPDVIGLQEALYKGNQFKEVVNGLGAPYRGLQPSLSIAESGIVYNSATLRLVENGHQQLPIRRNDRRIHWAVFEQKSTGKIFLFGTTHLDNGNGAARNQLRAKEAAVAVSVLKSVAARHGNCPTIVTGDLNSYPTKPGGNGGYEVFAESYLDPIGRASDPGVAKPEREIGTQYSSFNDFLRKARKTRTYLDYILVTPMRVEEWETVVKVDSSGDFIGTIPSDHNMVRADVHLP